jgi:hypothetical protein
LQEQVHDDKDQHHGFYQRLDDLLDRQLDEVGRVIWDGIFDIGREAFRHLFHPGLDQVGGPQSIGAGGQADSDAGGGLAIEAALGVVILLAQFDAAQDSRETKRISTGREISVRLLYWTAFVDGQGRVAFREDVYRRDQKLAEALGIAVSLPTVVDDGTAVANDVGP